MTTAVEPTTFARKDSWERPQPNSRLIGLSRQSASEALQSLASSPTGLTEAEAEARASETGPNVIAPEVHHGWSWRLVHAMRNPLVVLLSALAVVSFATGDSASASIMVILVVIGVVLRFTQEWRADAAAAKLRAMVHVTASVIRDGSAREVAVTQLVPGDLLRLSAGDIVPGDVRVISAKDLFINQSRLTGESFPVEKFDAICDRSDAALLELPNICFSGTSVESGTATAVVAQTGARTYFGQLAGSVTSQPPPSSFDRGISAFTWLMIGFIAVMVPLVFLVNGLAKHRWVEAFFFSLSVAVGLTPEMLPTIVSVCLAKGALTMSRRKVIVKQLNAIQNLGAMDVLCTDKTGTLTCDHVVLERYCDVAGEASDEVLREAYLISHFQTGLKSALDQAVLEHCDRHAEWNVENYRKVDEVPFDFSRRIMSVIVKTPQGGVRLLAKGAPEAILKRCTRFELNGEIDAIDDAVVQDIQDEYQLLSRDGFRVLAVAYRDVQMSDAYGLSDEQDLVLRGYVAFLDPPKETALAAIQALSGHGVQMKVLSGDNELVCRKVCSEVGISGTGEVLGTQIDSMSDKDLASAAEANHLFARVSPIHKRRIIQALRNGGHVVGFLGDGINDAPALHVADVGISVDSAVDVAKETAPIILLEKSLLVLDAGVMEGRKVFANILKYLRMGASSNFGNVFSILGASVFLPFLPMTPMQLLTNNMLYDFSQLPIPTDDVDPEQIARPRPWAIPDLRRFILFIGPISSIFDYTTFFIMLYVFGCWRADSFHVSLFQTGWFVESLMTQTLIIHVIRTNRIPFIQSWASRGLRAMTATIMAIGVWLPYSPFARAMHFAPLPWQYWPLLVLTLLCYVVLTQLIKTWLLRRKWI